MKTQRFKEYRYKTHDVYAWARHELDQTDPKRRELALHSLAKLQDRQALKHMAKQAEEDTDPTVRHIAAQLIWQNPAPQCRGAFRKIADTSR